MECISNQSLWTLLNEATPTAWRDGWWSGELELRGEAGHDIPVIGTLLVQPARRGNPDTMVLFAQDISAIRNTIGTLKRDQRFLRALLENVPDVIYFKDRESRFLRVNYAFSAKFGESNPEKLVGKTDFDFFTLEHAQAAFDNEQEILRTERPIVNLEEKETWPDGRVTWGSTTKMPFYNEYGQVIGTFGITRDITARKHAENALADSQRRLLDASRLAGMAEVASGVLHNVGNAFNSVNTAASLALDKLRASRLTKLAKLSELVEQHAADLPGFLSNDARGRQLPVYLTQLTRELLREREELMTELESLGRGVDHIKTVIAMQQSFADASSILEDLQISDLIDEALVMRGGGLARHRIEVQKDLVSVPPIRAPRHRVMEILVNLITNAEHALNDISTRKRVITLAVRPEPGARVRVTVSDNGVGIAAENLRRIFSFGFTTKKHGHGFGLHNSALAAKEMNGQLSANSAGPDQGAEFILILPTSETTDTTPPLPPGSYV
jgi:PAS domain S-box-containing protein